MEYPEGCSTAMRCVVRKVAAVEGGLGSEVVSPQERYFQTVDLYMTITHISTIIINPCYIFTVNFYYMRYIYKFNCRSYTCSIWYKCYNSKTLEQVNKKNLVLG